MRDSLTACAATIVALSCAPEPAHAQRRAPELVVEARLARTPEDMIRCGRVHAVYVFEYQVVRVVRGRYQTATIYVAHSCPELVRTGYGRGLRVGSTFRLTLSSRRPRLWPAPVDTLGHPEIARWNAVSVRWLSRG